MARIAPLGSTRLESPVNPTPTNVTNYDYLSFGGEIGAGTAGRDSTFPAGTYPSTPNGPSTRFTGKERDAETGLDYFGARYFSGAQGRFTSPDPFNVIGLAKSKDTLDKFHNYLSNPQHWNHYAYVLNNPLRYTDPLGLLEYDTTLLGKKIHVHIDDSLTDKRQNDLKGKVDSAISNINSNSDKLTKAQVGVLGNMKSIDVDSSAARSYSIESRGAFTLTPKFVNDSSKAYLGSAVGHDAFHMQEFNEGGISNSRGMPAEQKAFVFQFTTVQDSREFAVLGKVSPSF
jgi:RHS repeat-associated protein